MIESEKQIIGSILMEPESIQAVYGRLKPEMFVNDFFRAAYRNMLVMYDTGEEITSITLSNRLESNKMEKAYILKALGECFKETDSSAVIGHYANELISEYKAKQVKRLLGTASYLPNDIDKTIGYLIAELEAMVDNRETDCKTMKQIVSEYKGNYFRPRKKTGIKTGFYKLDDMLGALEPGDVTVIAARPGVGKSALVTQMISQMAERGNNVGYFNLEMNENQVYERFVARMAELDLTRVRRATQFLKDEENKFNNANDRLSEYCVTLSTGSKSISEIKQISRHQNFDIIIIDYLQLVIPERRNAMRSVEVGEISWAAKAMASELKTHVILLSQLNRASERTENKEPEVSELRESGSIEQDASNIILIWDLLKDNFKAKGVKVGKNRMGIKGKLGYEFDGEHMTFRERQESFEQYERTVRDMAKNSPKFKPCDDAPWE